MDRNAKPDGRREKGQSLVEFALVLPMFLLLMVGMAEFGRAWMARNVLTGAAREAARIAAVNGDAAAAQSRADAILASAGLTGASVTFGGDNAAFGTLTVTVAYNFPVTIAGFVPGLDRATFPLASSTSMRKEF